jgi:hypothetical protein
MIDWLRPGGLPRRSEISMDFTVVLFALGMAALTSLVFGLFPGLWQTRVRWIRPDRTMAFSAIATT